MDGVLNIYKEIIFSYNSAPKSKYVIKNIEFNNTIIPHFLSYVNQFVYIKSKTKLIFICY